MKLRRKWIPPYHGATAIIVLCFVSCAAVVSAGSKKDVNDPVLGEVISAFGQRLPRFTDRHGSTLFVADESVSRGALLLALYEYDKSLKLAVPKESVSRQEIDSLKARLNALESGDKREVVDPFAARAEILRDIEINLPTMLDNTLSKSQVFQASRGGQGADPGLLSGALSQIRSDVDSIKGKMARLENSGGGRARSDEAAQKFIESSIDGMREDIAKLKDMPAKLPSKADLADLRGRIEKVEKGNSELVRTGEGKSAEQLTELSAESKRVNQLAQDLRVDISSLKQKLSTVATTDDISAIQMRLTQVERANADVSRTLSTARSVPSDEEKSVSQSQARRIETTVQELRAELASIQKRIVNNPTNDDVIALRNRLAQVEKTNADLSRLSGDGRASARPGDVQFQAQADRLEESIKNLRSEYASLKTAADSSAVSDKVENLDARLTQIERQTSELARAGAQSRSVNAGSLRRDFDTLSQRMATLEKIRPETSMSELKTSLNDLQQRFDAISAKDDEMQNISQRLASLEDAGRMVRNDQSTAKGGNVQARADARLIEKRLALLEKTINEYASLARLPEEMRSEETDTKEQLKDLSRRLDTFEQATPRLKLATSSSQESSSPLLNKLSIGLSMVAALFIAR